MALAEYCLDIEHPERALAWLEGEWERRFERDQQTLRERCYQQLGMDDKLRQSRQAQFDKYPGWHTLQLLLEVLDEESQQTLLAQARRQAASYSNLSEAIDVLLRLDETALAGEAIKKRHAELDNVYYQALIQWAKQLGESEPLAAALCYRALLEDILSQGRSKAYRYAARYFNKLLTLDTRIDSYRPHSDTQQYIRQLQEQHWRKRSFWELADHPNKADEG